MDNILTAGFGRIRGNIQATQTPDLTFENECKIGCFGSHNEAMNRKNLLVFTQK